MKVLRLLLKLLLTGVVTWFILEAVEGGLQELNAFDLSALSPRWGLLFLSCALLLVAYLYSASLWGVMVRELGGPPVSALAALRVFFTANLGRYVPGKVWQLAGVAYLARREGVTAPTATAAALLGQGFSLAGATLVGLGVLLEGGVEWELPGRWVAGGILAILLILTFPAFLRPLLARLLRRVPGANLGPLWPDQAFGVRWLGLYGLGWILQGVAFWLLVLGMGLEMGLFRGAAIFPAAYLLGYVAVFAPAGLGIREGFLILFLTPILGTGSGVVAVSARLWTTLLELLPALPLAGGYLRGVEDDRKEGGPSG